MASGEDERKHCETVAAVLLSSVTFSPYTPMGMGLLTARAVLADLLERERRDAVDGHHCACCDHENMSRKRGW